MPTEVKNYKSLAQKARMKLLVNHWHRMDAATVALSKTLDRRLCTGRSGEAVVIFLFGLEALLTIDSRVLSCVVSSSPKLKTAIG